MVDLVWYFSIAAQAAVVCRLLYLGLPSQYPRFLYFAFFTFCKSMAQLSVVRSPSYPLVWVITESLSVVFLLAVAIEIYEQTVGKFPSAGDFGSRKLGRLALSGVLVALALFVFLEPPVFWRKSVSVVLALKAFWLTATVAFVLISWLYYARLVVPERLNVRRHRVIFLLSCFLQAVTLSLTLVAGRTIWNLPLAACNAACWVAWAVVLTRSGEVQRTPAAPPSRLNRLREGGRDLASALASESD